MLTTGTKVPDIKVIDESETEKSLADFKGQKVILYFYPKDNTPGCTIESCGFRDAYHSIKAAGGEVLGVSRDTAKKHQNFIKKYDLPFSLLADVDQKLCDAFGVMAQKSMFGKKYMGIERSTFLIDEDGIIQHVWPKVKISGHVDEVLLTLRSMKSLVR